MDDRQEIFGHFRIVTFGNGVVVVASALAAIRCSLSNRPSRPAFPEQQRSLQIHRATQRCDPRDDC